MPRDSVEQDDQLVNQTTQVLRSYSEMSHLEYPRLMAARVKEDEIAKKLGKSPDIVEFHLEKFFSQLPDLRDHPNRHEILSLAISNRDKLGPLVASAEPPKQMPDVTTKTVVTIPVSVSLTPPPVHVPSKQEPQAAKDLTAADVESRMKDLTEKQLVLLCLAGDTTDDLEIADTLSKIEGINVTEDMVQARFIRICTTLKMPDPRSERARTIAIAAYKLYAVKNPVKVSIVPVSSSVLSSAPSSPTPPRSSAPEKEYIPPPSIKVPSDEDVARRINGLPPAKRRFLALMMNYETPPPPAKIALEYGGKELTVNALCASVFSHVGLTVPRQMKDAQPWMQYRFKILRRVYHSEKVSPPRESKMGHSRKTIPLIDKLPLEEPKTPPSITTEFVDHRVENSKDQDGVILSVTHLPSLPKNKATLAELLDSGYRIEKSYMVGETHDPTTVVVLVKRGKIISR